MKGSSANRVGQTDSLGQPLAPGGSFGGGTIGSDTDAIIRAGFIRKVYGILAIQLMVTFGAMRRDELQSEAVLTRPVRLTCCRLRFVCVTRRDRDVHLHRRDPRSHLRPTVQDGRTQRRGESAEPGSVPDITPALRGRDRGKPIHLAEQYSHWPDV